MNALVSIGGNIAFESIDRLAVRRFFCAMQQPDGSFTLHNNGEVDIRLVLGDLFPIPFLTEYFQRSLLRPFGGQTAQHSHILGHGQ